MDILESIKEKLSIFNAEITHVYTETAFEPDMGSTVDNLNVDSKIKEALKEIGIKRVYKYQEEAINKILNRENILIVSGTGTGKTEAFLIPILNFAINGEKSVLIYPTKALARDQLNRICKLVKNLPVRVGVIDGDTPRIERNRIYEDPPEILITNPDMIHIGLAMSRKFSETIRQADHFVFDEIHVYEGVLGSHLRMIIDRLRDINSKIHIIASSATIGASPYMFEAMFGEEGEIIHGSNRRKGMAFHILVNSNGVSRWTLSAYLAANLIKLGLKVLIFTDSQQMAEVTAKIAQRFGADLEVHRAGILPEERLRVEQGLRQGKVNGVVATPTLELGIDIGNIDAVIMAENPPSYPKYLQRAGRAGRRNNAGYVFTILSDDPIDSYFLRKPQEFFTRKLTPIPFDVSNIEVIKVHAAAYILEKYMVKIKDLPTLWQKACKELESHNIIRFSNGVAYATKYTRKFVLESSLRSSGPIVKIYHNDKKIGERELPIALYDLYPNAVYIVSKRNYIVDNLDLERMIATVKKANDNLSYYTKPLYSVDVKDFNEIESRNVFGLPVKYGEIMVKVSVEGYTVHDLYSKKDRSSAEYKFENPLSYSYRTKGLIIKHPILNEFTLIDGMEAYHATEHVLISAGRVVAGASLTDLSGISYPSGHVVIYDSTVGGSGVSKLLYERLEDAYEVALDIVGKCDCEDGCPKCIYDPYCGNNNRVLSRKKSLRLISEVIKGTSTKDEEFWGESIR